MKRLLLALFLISVVGLTSCEDTVTSCWIITLKTVTTVSPSMPGYPKTETTNIEKCDLTEAQVDEAMKGMVGKTTQTSNGYTVTVTMTATKAKK